MTSRGCAQTSRAEGLNAAEPPPNSGRGSAAIDDRRSCAAKNAARTSDALPGPAEAAVRGAMRATLA